MTTNKRYLHTSQIFSLQQPIFCLLLLLALLSACKSTQQAIEVKKSDYLSADVRLTIPHNGAIFTVDGILKMKRGEIMQLSFLMPILRTEVARIELTPETILLVDRMGRRYARIAQEELKKRFHIKINTSRLEKMLDSAAQPNGKRSITAADLGFSGLEHVQFELSGFSDKTLNIAPTQLSDKYKAVNLEELMQLLISLTQNH